MTVTDASAATPAPSPGVDDIRVSHVSLRRRITNRVATAGIVASFFIALVPLALIVGYVVVKGASIVNAEFLTADIPNSYRAEGPGMGPAVAGTLVITAFASLLAIPIGILGAIYLNEYGRDGVLARFIRFMTDVMTGVPSVVMGLFIYTIWVTRFEAQTGLAAALALACLMLPLVVRATEEVLRLVPEELRAASDALGARTWRTTLGVVVPAALPGIVSGAMLAIARAAGETAPVVLVAGLTLKTNWNLFEGQNTTLAAQIFRNAARPFDGAQQRAYGAALSLIVIVFLFTLAARFIAARFTIAER